MAKGCAASPTKTGLKGQSKQADADRCNYCGGYGHWKRDCRKFQADKASGQVRLLENEDTSQRAASRPSSTGRQLSTLQVRSHSSAGNVNRGAFNDSTVIIEDLTEFSDFTPGQSSLCTIQPCLQQCDMA